MRLGVGDKKYYPEIVFMRAIACLMVVMVHAVSANLESPFHLTLNEISRLGTPIFAFISSFLLFNSVNNSGFNSKRFVTSRINKIFIPYIFWSLLYLGIYLHTYEYMNFKIVTAVLLFGRAQYHLYFMAMILQFYILFLILHKIRSRNALIAFYIVSLIINYFTLTMNPDIAGLKPILEQKGLIIKWCAYIALGAVFATYIDWIKKHVLKHKVVIAILFIISVVYMLIAGVRNSMTPSNLVIIPIFILFLLNTYPMVAKWKRLSETFNLIGNYSMGIYLIHPLIINLLQKVLPETFAKSPYLVLIFFALILLLSILSVRIILSIPYLNAVVFVPTHKKRTLTEIIQSRTSRA